MSKVISVDCSRIRDWESFHDVFAATFGFPTFYGRNLDAWIDCMTRLDEEFSDVQVDQGEVIVLKLENSKSLKERSPEILTAIFELASFVNYRRMESGEQPILIISAYV